MLVTSVSRSFRRSAFFPRFVFRFGVYSSYVMPSGWVVYVYHVHGRFVHVSDVSVAGSFLYFVSEFPF